MIHGVLYIPIDGFELVGRDGVWGRSWFQWVFELVHRYGCEYFQGFLLHNFQISQQLFRRELSDGLLGAGDGEVVAIIFDWQLP